MELSLCHLSRYPNSEKKETHKSPLLPHPSPKFKLMSRKAFCASSCLCMQEPWRNTGTLERSHQAVSEKMPMFSFFWNSIKARWNSSLQRFTWPCIWHENFVTLRNFVTLIQTYCCMRWSKTKSRMHLRNKPHIFITTVQCNFKWIQIFTHIIMYLSKSLPQPSIITTRKENNNWKAVKVYNQNCALQYYCTFWICRKACYGSQLNS